MKTLKQFSKLQAIQSQIQAFPEGEASLGYVFDEVISATEAISDGRKILLAGANSYLGLNHNPEVKAACINGINKAGVGTTGSRLANGCSGVKSGSSLTKPFSVNLTS